MATTLSAPMPRVCISAVHPNDAAALQLFTRRLSAASRRTRYVGMARMAGADSGPPALSLIARDRDSGIVVGHALAVRTGAGTAEVALALADAYKNRQIGTLLLTRLMAEAQRDGVCAFSAEIEAGNGRMLETFAREGYDLALEPGANLVRASRHALAR
jgi:GNAT superfamily N-acetyltransferase